MRRIARTALLSAVVAAWVVLSTGGVSGAATGPGATTTVPPSTSGPDSGLTRALQDLVRMPAGPPGAIVVIERHGALDVVTAGTSVLGGSTPIEPTDHLRLASVSKALSGAVALSLVARHTLWLSDTIGKWLPGLPQSWSKVTLAQLLQHTSGIPDFSGTPKFRAAVNAHPYDPPAPASLLSYVEDKGLLFTPGTDYRYSNSDNVIVGLMIQAATGRSYEQELQSQVFGPLGLTGTSLPSGADLPEPYAHGYAGLPAEPEDVSHAFAAGWAWASGGIVSTPLDTTTFIRGYASGVTTDPATREAQFQFRPGNSEPPGPGTNSAGLAIFRYQTPCGTVYGHTGNTAGFTQFVAATADGSRSVVVSVNSQLTPATDADGFAALHHVYALAVCSALDG